MIRLTVLIASMVYLIISIHNFTNALPISTKIISPFKIEALKSLEYLKAPKDKLNELSDAVDNAARITGNNPTLLVCLMHTESRYKNNAISSKGYKGLMQTPSASFKYSDVDILYGARILQDKLKQSNNDLLTAISLYKGGNNRRARELALETVELYRLVSLKIKEANDD